MALETLKDVKEIGGYKLTEPGHGVTNKEWEEYDKSHPICINHDKNRISFRIQNGPIKEVGVNGCQVDTIIETAKKILEGLNAKFPSEYNKTAINNLDLAIKALQQRTKDREARGVEGTSNE